MCKHQNGILREHVEAWHDRAIENGAVTKDSNNDYGDIIGYDFDCEDCGKRIKLRGYKPKWLWEYTQELIGK